MAFDNEIIKIFDTQISRYISSYKYSYSNLFEIRFSKNEERIVIAENSSLQLFDWKSGEVIQFQRLHNKPSKAAIGRIRNLLAIRIC